MSFLNVFKILFEKTKDDGSLLQMDQTIEETMTEIKDLSKTKEMLENTALYVTMEIYTLKSIRQDIETKFNYHQMLEAQLNRAYVASQKLGHLLDRIEWGNLLKYEELKRSAPSKLQEYNREMQDLFNQMENRNIIIELRKQQGKQKTLLKMVEDAETAFRNQRKAHNLEMENFQQERNKLIVKLITGAEELKELQNKKMGTGNSEIKNISSDQGCGKTYSFPLNVEEPSKTTKPFMEKQFSFTKFSYKDQSTDDSNLSTQIDTSVVASSSCSSLEHIKTTKRVTFNLTSENVNFDGALMFDSNRLKGQSKKQNPSDLRDSVMAKNQREETIQEQIDEEGSNVVKPMKVVENKEGENVIGEKSNTNSVSCEKIIISDVEMEIEELPVNGNNMQEYESESTDSLDRTLQNSATPGEESKNTGNEVKSNLSPDDSTQKISGNDPAKVFFDNFMSSEETSKRANNKGRLLSFSDSEEHFSSDDFFDMDFSDSHLGSKKKGNDDFL